MATPIVTPLQLPDYLESLPGTTLKKLYQAPPTALAIFRRMLTPLAKTIVAKICYLPEPLPLHVLDLMIKREVEAQRDQALTVLRKLHILNISSPAPGRPAVLTLNPVFQESYKSIIENRATYGNLSSDPAPPHVSPKFLKEYGTRKLDSILQFVVNSTASHAAVRVLVGDVVKRLLTQGHLVSSSEIGGLRITQAGFSFLLQQSNAQVWALLIMWLTSAGGNVNMDAVDMLTFLFQLSFGRVGHPYDTDALSESRKNMLPDLVDFGLIYIDKDSPSQYFPTPLAANLGQLGSLRLRSISLSDSFESVLESRGSGEAAGIMVETNYRIYCYTTSPLQIAVLALFAEVKERMPNMVAAKLTKRSIQRAVDFGITAEQVIRYLATHAHEQMKKEALAANRAVLPPTVTDQIRLWQLDRERLKHEDGFLFKDFADKDEYVKCAQYAEETGILLWKSDDRQCLFVSRHEQLGVYLKLRKKAGV